MKAVAKVAQKARGKNWDFWKKCVGEVRKNAYRFVGLEDSNFRNHISMGRFTDVKIQKILADGLANERQLVEEVLYAEYRYFVRTREVKAILHREDDRLSAYHDAFIAVVAAISNGLYRSNASVKNFFWKIFYFKCVTLSRANATLKSGITHPSTEPLDDLLNTRPVGDIESHFNIIDSENAELLMETFRREHYKCYFLILLYDMEGLSAEQVITLVEHQVTIDSDGSEMRLDEMIDVDDESPKTVKFPSVQALRMAASRCREKLRAFVFEQLNLPQQTYNHAR